MSLLLISVVPYSDDTPNVNESEPESAPLSKRTTLSRSIHVDGHSPFELKSLKRREKFGRETTDTFHSPVNGENGFHEWSEL